LRDVYTQKYLRPVQEGDVEFIAANIRDQDRDEVRAKCGPLRSIAGVIRSSLLDTPEAVTAISPTTGEPIAIIGAAAPTLLGGGIGKPWMLGTPGVATAPRGFIQGGRAYVQRMLDLFPEGLENYVDARNSVSIRWLRALGFKMHPAQPYGEEQRLFHRFTLGCA